MIYHSTWRDRFFFLLILAVCAGLVIACAFFFATRSGAVRSQAGQGLIVSAGLLAAAVYLNRIAWNATVAVGDPGVEWKDGKTTVTLAWDDILGFGTKAERKVLKAGLVVKSTKELKLLPFLSQPLYDALKPRCGRLPVETEKTLGVRS